ncbi:hypothetical protein QQY66_01375 [Streptomyces sp. DG2A-72]|uniref:hypothetical protein n=1 Tax=Streptomyces sp. DG2A-72 TaxID=3051386 RepID=UPI00265C542C|nr:hypothetical protein [Streptomyces sp. DG2A-72]MDO0930413.1 hypothetical protein [Streptomyces sp. DG2A-72]
MDQLGDAGWMEGVASGKITDFAGEADAADAAVLRDYTLVKRVALIACLVHKARMRVRDDLATMFCKPMALKIKRAKAELEEIRLAEDTSRSVPPAARARRTHVIRTADLPRRHTAAGPGMTHLAYEHD